jgi:hypothetical protein
VKLILENIRTFSGHHEIPIRPLTLLTGENSTGKSTLLGMLSAVCDDGFPFQPAFNKPPFDFGNYDTIATFKGGRFGRATSFSLGLDDELEPARRKRFVAKYTNLRGQFQLKNFELTAQNFSLSLEVEQVDDRQIRGKYSVTVLDKTVVSEFSLADRSLDARINPLVRIFVDAINSADVKAEEGRITFGTLNYVSPLVSTNTIAIAPIRTKPERTYSQIREAYMPTGDHIPFLLEQLLRRDSTNRSKLLRALKQFGDESGLFKSLQVRHLGDRATDPFQLLVTVAGRASNLVDVGYGVSQALPVIVQASLMEGDQTLLLQQPEVHLHPRAQAALGTFFSLLAASGSSKFLVETHSEYIIDRIRQEVTKKAIPLEKVGILYFQRNGLESDCALLVLDANGNIINPPPDYRDFFLREEVNLLTRTERSN